MDYETVDTGDKDEEQKPGTQTAEQDDEEETAEIEAETAQERKAREEREAKERELRAKKRRLIPPFVMLLAGAAEKGVDVKLILPGIPDKPMPYALAKGHYKSLLDSGVKIYEYTPGFVHAKVFVSDDCRAVVGTINLDYRSLYHHFECAAYMYRTECIPDIEKDFQATLAGCRQVTPETVKNEKWNVKLTGFVMKAVAPLL